MNVAQIIIKIIKHINARDGKSHHDFIIGVVLEFLIIATSVAGPLFLKYAIDALTGADRNAGLAAALMVAFVASWSLTSIIGAGRLIYTSRISQWWRGRICSN